MNKQDNRRISECMQNILGVLDKMAGDTKRLQSAMQNQEELIRGDNIMNETMELLREINLSVSKMKRSAERVADSVKEGADDMRQVQRVRSNNIRRT
ncbi:MAG: hypothetical protein IKD03_00740 [Clostridia bacterium]|nr:hypothetical protein [Clostridia bacterium]